MTLLIALLAAGPMMLPEIPQSALEGLVRRIRRDGFANISVVVDDEANVTRCEVLQSDWPEGISLDICEYLNGRNFRQAATGPSGEPVFSRVIFDLRLSQSANSPELNSDRPAHFTVEVEQLPAADRPLKKVSVVAFIQPDGVVSNCAQMPGQEADFSEVACTQTNKFTLAPMIDQSGLPVPFLTVVTVDFVEAAGP